jgi:hypothetical protein
MHTNDPPTRPAASARGRLATALALAIAVGLPGLVAGPVQASSVVYQSTFSSGTADPAWDHPASFVTAPSGERFLGQFGNNAAKLTVVPAGLHSQLTLSFDLYIIETWDGNGGTYQSNADEWRLTGPSGQVLIDTSFSNCDRESQAYPWPLGVGSSYAYSGAQATGSLGYGLICYYTEGVGDSTYHFQVTVNHALPAATFTFEAVGLQTLDDESWGLDNVVVTAA